MAVNLIVDIHCSNLVTLSSIYMHLLPKPDHIFEQLKIIRHCVVVRVTVFPDSANFTVEKWKQTYVNFKNLPHFGLLILLFWIQGHTAVSNNDTFHSVAVYLLQVSNEISPLPLNLF